MCSKQVILFCIHLNEWLLTIKRNSFFHLLNANNILSIHSLKYSFRLVSKSFCNKSALFITSGNINNIKYSQHVFFIVRNFSRKFFSLQTLKACIRFKDIAKSLVTRIIIKYNILQYITSVFALLPFHWTWNQITSQSNDCI